MDANSGALHLLELLIWISGPVLGLLAGLSALVAVWSLWGVVFGASPPWNGTEPRAMEARARHVYRLHRGFAALAVASLLAIPAYLLIHGT